MMNSRRYAVFVAFLTVLSATASPYTNAASFTIENGQVVTTPQTLNANETGIIEPGGQLSVVDTTAITTISPNVTINNGGTITVTATGPFLGQGISANGDDITVINSGSITVTGTGGTNGITAGRVNATVINSGTITVTADNANGIVLGDDNAIVTNSGTIITTGNNAQGIRVSALGDNAVITNSGTIKTTGTNADGIRVLGANNSVINSGSVTVTGAGAIGISLDAIGADDNVLSNSGVISANGAATQAIVGGTGSNIVNIETGSQIFGAIDLGGGTDEFNVLGLPSASSVMTVNNAETVSLASSLPGVVKGNTVTTVDPSMTTAQGAALTTLTAGFHNAINQRMARTQPLPPIQLAALEMAPGMLFQERAPIVWGEVFGAHRQRGADELVQAYTHDMSGFIGGYERDYRKARVGVFAGFASGDIATDVTSIQTDTDSFFGGAYAHLHLGAVNLTASLAAGAEDHDNNRTVIDNIAGIETARSDFNSTFISPSLSLNAAYALNEYFELRPSATLIYTAAWYDDYQETGTTNANLSVDDRTDHLISGRLQVAVGMAPNDATQFELRSGVVSRYADQGDIRSSLAGASFQYAAAGDDSITGGFVGGNIRYYVSDKVDVLADVEYIGSSGDESDISGRLRVEYRF